MYTTASDTPIIEPEVNLPLLTDYDLESSCLRSMRVNKVCSSKSCSFILISDLFEYKDKIIDVSPVDYKVNNFCSNLGIDLSLIKTIILSYLASQPSHMLDKIMKYYTFDQNILGWMVYHSTNISLFKKCIGFEHKGTNKKCCVICHATTNIIDKNYGRVTVSPTVYTGGRYPQKPDSHFVVWAYDHNAIVNVTMVASATNASVYEHGKPQYGHHHCHVLIGSEIHDIRAREIMEKSQRLMNVSQVLDDSDYFYPLDAFFMKCSQKGKLYILIALIIPILQLTLPEGTNISMFYRLSYLDTIRNHSKDFFKHKFNMSESIIT